MSRYLVVIRQNDNSRFAAFSPDLPNCTATGQSREEVERKIRAVVEFHIASRRRAGEKVPPPISEATYCDVDA